MSRKFGGKLLLFGEYTVLLGGKALGIPFNACSGTFVLGKNESLTPLFNFLLLNDWGDISINKVRIKEEIGQIRFESTIPEGYGVGSSGALSAAIFDRYFEAKMSSLEAKDILSTIESQFHGKSSGFDPLISYFNKSFTIEKNQVSEVSLSSMENMCVYLLDSQKSRNTKALVDLFHQKLNQKPTYLKRINHLTLMNNNLIESWVNEGNVSYEDVADLSQSQYELFPEFIPKNILNIWVQGIESKEFYCKLCGAGGGGYFLIFSKNTNLKLKGFDLNELGI